MPKKILIFAVATLMSALTLNQASAAESCSLQARTHLGMSGVMLLQKFLGQKQDGVCGPETVNATRELYNDLRFRGYWRGAEIRPVDDPVLEFACATVAQGAPFCKRKIGLSPDVLADYGFTNQTTQQQPMSQQSTALDAFRSQIAADGKKQAAAAVVRFKTTVSTAKRLRGER